jgi:hypothetical protein
MCETLKKNQLKHQKEYFVDLLNHMNNWHSDFRKELTKIFR